MTRIAGYPNSSLYPGSDLLPGVGAALIATPADTLSLADAIKIARDLHLAESASLADAVKEARGISFTDPLSLADAAIPRKNHIAQSLGSNQIGGSSPSIAATPNAAGVGDFVLVAFAWAASTPRIQTVTDTKGNAWTIVQTPASANETGGYAYCTVAAGKSWGNGGNTVTATLDSGTPGGRVWAAVGIPAASLVASPVDQHVEAQVTSLNPGVSSGPLGQAQEVALVIDLVRAAGSTTVPVWTWNPGWTQLASATGSGTLNSGVAIAEHDNDAGTHSLTGGFTGAGATDQHGLGIITVKVTGAVAWTQNVNDSLSLAEAAAFGRAIMLADAAALGDSAARSVGYGRLLADAAALADTSNATRGVARALSDSLALADNQAHATGKGISLSETLALADAIRMSRALSVAETLALADQIQKGVSIIVADAFSLTDARALTRTFTIDEAVALADGLAQTAGAGLSAALSDTVGVSDQVALAKAVQRAIADTLNLADAAAFSKGHGISIADTLALLDAATRGQGRAILVADALAMADARRFDRDMFLADLAALTDAQFFGVPARPIVTSRTRATGRGSGRTLVGGRTGRTRV